MDVTMIGLQNAGKSSLLRVLAVRSSNHQAAPELADRCNREASSLSSKSLSPWRRIGKQTVNLTTFITDRLFFFAPHSSIPTIGFNTKRVQKGHVTLKWLVQDLQQGRVAC